MILDFDKSAAQVVPHFKGGAGEAQVRTAVQDGMGRILTLTLPVGSSIGCTPTRATVRSSMCCPAAACAMTMGRTWRCGPV